MTDVLQTEVAQGVLVGPLFTDRTPEELARSLVRLLRSLGIRNSEIRKMSVNERIGYARVWLKEEEREDWVVGTLRMAKDDMKLDMFHDLVHMMEDPSLLVVEPVKEEVIKERWTVNNEAIGHYNVLFLSQTKLADLAGIKSNTEVVEEQTNNGNQSPAPSGDTTPQELARHREEASITGGETIVQSDVGENEAGSSVDLAKVDQVSAKTSTPFVVPCDCPETVFYHQFQHVGTETRHAEFKRGGIIHDQNAFKDLISRYICGFLNSEGGTIYFGVDDEGMVLGVRIDEELKEHLKRDIKYAIDLVQPIPPASEYSINFANVMGASGEIMPDQRVLEVCIRPREASQGRHVYKDKVYIRRDGSLQTLHIAKVAPAV